jgi:hypothetical protein
MTIRQIRILPPLAFARLGSAAEPQDNYTIEENLDHPLGFRRIKGAETPIVDEASGEIRETRVPRVMQFKHDGKIRPVAPFLEVFALTEKGVLEPLDLDLLQRHRLGPENVSWQVSVANRKVVRRTGDADDLVAAETGWFSSHEPQRLLGHCKNFIGQDAGVDFGRVRYIKPNAKYPQIRLRFTPAHGLIYGPNKPKENEQPPIIPAERAIYDMDKGGWCGFELKVPDDASSKDPLPFLNETLPPSLFAIIPPAPSWLHGNKAVSRGYLDDACDGFIEVALTFRTGERLVATARISSGPPALIPDSLFVRSLADDLDQVIHGPVVPKDEPYEVTRARAEDIIRRAYETVRFMNVAVMNGNTVKGRPPLSLDTMPAEEAFDTERMLRPVMSEESVDTLAVLALHQQVFAALRGGAAPWFVRLLRRPDEVADYTDQGRRKMPALMCGADNNYLALTHRQIDTICKAAGQQPFGPPVAQEGSAKHAAGAQELTPRNLSAQLHYAAMGNPVSSRPVAAIGNCCPGLEVDFRAVWRRIFEGIVLREYDNLVVEVDPGLDDPKKRGLAGHRLLRVAGIPVVTQMTGPSPADPTTPVVLATEANPHGVAPLEWSNALARVLRDNKGQSVTCDFTKEESWYQQQPWIVDPGTGAPSVPIISLEFKVRPFFDEDTAVISKDLAHPGELTQGLCSPWQNDYRECSCYYWASARPDYINVEPTPAGVSRGDNWLQKTRTGQYVPDDYADTRLILYDDLFQEWERWLRFQVGGRDARDGAEEDG